MGLCSEHFRQVPLADGWTLSALYGMHALVHSLLEETHENHWLEVNTLKDARQWNGFAPGAHKGWIAVSLAPDSDRLKMLADSPAFKTHGFIAYSVQDTVHIGALHVPVHVKIRPTLSVFRATSSHDTELVPFGMQQARILTQANECLDYSYLIDWRLRYLSPLLPYELDQEQELLWAVECDHPDRQRVRVFAAPWVSLVPPTVAPSDVVLPPAITESVSVSTFRAYSDPDVLSYFNSICPFFVHFRMPLEDDDVLFMTRVMPLLKIRTPGTVALRYMYDPAPSNQRNAAVMEDVDIKNPPRAAALYKMFKVTALDKASASSTLYRGGSILNLAKLLSQFLTPECPEFQVLYVDVLVSNADYPGSGKFLMDHLHKLATALAIDQDVWLVLEPKTQALLHVYAAWTFNGLPFKLVSYRPGVYFMAVRCEKQVGRTPTPLNFVAAAGMVRDCNKTLKRDAFVTDMLKAEDACMKNLDKVWDDLRPPSYVLEKVAEQAKLLLKAHALTFHSSPTPALAWRTFLALKSRVELASSSPEQLKVLLNTRLGEPGVKTYYISTIL